MIVDDLRLEDQGEGLVQHSARVRWSGVEQRLAVSVAPGCEPRADDASGFAAMTLLPAMKVGEDLRVEGSVCPVLMGGLRSVRAAYASWNPTLVAVSIEAAEERSADAAAGRGTAAFFSRGVDSTYTAATQGHEIDTLLFCQGFEPHFSPETQVEDVRRGTEAAGRLRLPLTAARTNARELVDRLELDAEDTAGALLALLAHSHSGRIERVLISSSDSFGSIEPCGTSPVIDPLLSTAATSLEHAGMELDRPGKLGYLVAERPELLTHLKVCVAGDYPGNCGRCGKCLVTMTALAAAGGLEQASGFPDEIPLDAVRTVNLNTFEGRLTWSHIAAAVDDEELRLAMLEALERSASADPKPPRGFRHHRLQAIRSLVGEGRPWPPTADRAQTPLGLVRMVDREKRRHFYAIHSLPPGELDGELGALCAEPDDGRVPVWLDDWGRISTDGYRPVKPDSSRRGRVRWALAPLKRGEVTETARRLLRRRQPAAAPDPHPDGPPAATSTPTRRPTA